MQSALVAIVIPHRVAWLAAAGINAADTVVAAQSRPAEALAVAVAVAVAATVANLPDARLPDTGLDVPVPALTSADKRFGLVAGYIRLEVLAGSDIAPAALEEQAT